MILILAGAVSGAATAAAVHASTLRAAIIAGSIGVVVTLAAAFCCFVVVD